MNGNEKRNAFTLEYWAILCLILPLSIAILILGLQVSGWRGSEDLAEGIVRDNWIIVVLVQLVSQILGLILVTALCAIVKIHLETSVAKGPVSIEQVRFLNALSLARPLLSTRATYTIIAVLVAVLSSVPGALWAGAISPHLDTNTIDRHVQIPSYPNSFIQAFLDQMANETDRDTTVTGALIQNDKGFFADDPNEYTDSLLTSAQRASNQQHLHPKLDNTGYTYVGRSFGTGSLVGFEPINDTKRPLAYTYHETGIVADVHCFQNTSSKFKIVEEDFGYSSSGWPGTLGQTAGFWPDGSSVGGTWLFGSIIGDLFAIGAPHAYGQRYADIVVASAGVAGSRMSTATYNHAQCKVTFASHDVRLDVNTTSRTITTTKLDEVPWPHYADFVVQMAMDGPAALTTTDNGFGGSRVERSMRLNTEVLYYDMHGNFPGYSVSDGLLYQSISDFMTDVMDNVMVVTGACQREYWNMSETVDTTVTVPAVVYGHKIFVYGMLSLTALITLICVGYITSTRAWKDTVQIDFTDPSNVALNTSKGGAALFRGFAERERNGLHDISITLADPSSKWPGIVRATEVDKDGGRNSYLMKSVSEVSYASQSLFGRSGQYQMLE